MPLSFPFLFSSGQSACKGAGAGGETARAPAPNNHIAVRESHNIDAVLFCVNKCHLQ